MANYKKWSNEEMEFIKNNHGIVRDEELAVKLSQMTGQNVTTAMIRRQRRKLSLKKSRGRPKKQGILASNNQN